MAIEHENIYRDIDELPIYNFYKCFEGKYNYIYINRRGVEKPEIESVWKSIYDKYCELTYNNSTLKYYRLIGEIQFLKDRKIFAPILLNLLTKTPKDETQDIVKELRRWKLKVNINNDLKQEFEKASRILNNSDNSLKRKISELEAIKDKPKETLSLQTQKAKLHKALGIEINLHTTSVTEWLAYWDELKHIKHNV